VLYAAQSDAQIDAEIAKKSGFRTETDMSVSRQAENRRPFPCLKGVYFVIQPRTQTEAGSNGDV